MVLWPSLRLSIHTMFSTDNILVARIQHRNRRSVRRRKCRLNHGDSNGCKRQLLESPEKPIHFPTYFFVKHTRSRSDMADFDALSATKQIF